MVYLVIDEAQDRFIASNIKRYKTGESNRDSSK